MNITIDAVVENGLLRPLKPLPVQEGQQVKITLEDTRSMTEQTAGMMQWKGDPEEARRIAEDWEFGLENSP